MPQLRAIIFDLDGTLLDSAPDIRQALNMTLRENGRRDVTLAEVKQMVGDGLLTTLNCAFAATGVVIPPSESYAKFQQFVAYYRNIRPDPSQLYPLVPETLKALTGRGVKLGLCTNKQEAATIRLMAQLDLLSFFSFVAGGDTFPVHKPNPGHVTGVLEKLDVKAEETLMIGDSANDVKAATGAGISCLLVTHGYGADMENLGAMGLISGFDALEQAAAKLGFTI